ncbi:MAG TPA: electron transfer flavoprotein subunit alpha/FixB family protein [Ktedonobacteraceae bacterium]|nr:electron transfer flavoprotein subunit alpha/FixB family protein [Ktedonobacteraceae bacterium]
MPEIWAVLEHAEGALAEESGELLAALHELARRQVLSTTLCALLLATPDTLLPEIAVLAGYGVREVYCIEHPLLDHYITNAYVSALAWLIQRHDPPLLIAASATANGRDWMPRLAARLVLPFLPGCLGIDLHNDALFALRTMYEGRAYVQTHTALHGRPALVTLAPGIRGAPGKLLTVGTAAITHFTPDIMEGSGEEHIRRVALRAPKPEEIELEAAEKIVAGGRGIGRAGFTQVAAFARLLGAAVGATRVATDKGWVKHERQIGATGKTVHPKLYIACGISGAAQHTSGMSEAQTVIAINPDRGAPLLARADLALLGDANEVLALAEKMLTL